MKPFKIDRNVQSNIEPKLEYFNDYVRNPINVKKENRIDSVTEKEEVVFVYDEELYRLNDWEANGMEILGNKVRDLKQQNASLILEQANQKIVSQEQQLTNANMLLEIALLKGGVQ